MDGLSTTRASSTSWESTSAVSEQPMSPKSRPGGLDLYGKRRQLVKVQILEREIGFLQEELKSIEGLQPASRCCKELDDFIGAKPDPLVDIIKGTKKSHPWWKRLWLPWICCSSGSQPRLDYCACCCCPLLCYCNLPLCSSCSEKKTCQSCFKCKSPSCPYLGCCCCCCCNISSCAEVNFGCNCSKTCCSSCCL